MMRVEIGWGIDRNRVEFKVSAVASRNSPITCIDRNRVEFKVNQVTTYNPPPNPV